MLSVISIIPTVIGDSSLLAANITRPAKFFRQAELLLPPFLPLKQTSMIMWKIWAPRVTMAVCMCAHVRAHACGAVRGEAFLAKSVLKSL